MSASSWSRAGRGAVRWLGARWARLRRGGAALLEISTPDRQQLLRRISMMERDIVLPVKAAGVGMLLYAFLGSTWIRHAMDDLSLVVEWTRYLLWYYTPTNILIAIVLLAMRRLPLGLVQWVVFFSGLLDAILLSALTLITAGYQSFLYWLFLVLIIRSAVSVPRASSQLALHVTIITCYLIAGFIHIRIAGDLDEFFRGTGERPAHLVAGATNSENATQPVVIVPREPRLPDRNPITNRVRRDRPPHPTAPVAGPTDPVAALDNPWQTGPLEREAEPALVRLALLVLVSVCSYGVQVLFERQRKAEDEAREFAMREGQLQAAGRLAAEFTHQMKNPLAIITNAAFSLQKALRQGRTDVAEQIQIIQEEVDHSDRIITQIMGYAQLSEGRVEKLDVVEELDQAVAQVLPPAAGYPVRVQRDYRGPFPPLLMLRRHVSETFINLLQNARDALGEAGGVVTITARCHSDYSVGVTIADDGPGIPAEKRERVFEAYYTTKPKGTGLGLATVKHNVELYGGSIRLESELGKGARFHLVFPARTILRLEAKK